MVKVIRGVKSSKLQSLLQQDTMNGPKQEEVKAEEAALAELEKELQDRSGFSRLQIANHLKTKTILHALKMGFW